MLDDMDLERAAGHHDQGPRRRDAVHARRAGVRAEPDRHAGPRRFSLRSLAQSWPAAKGRSCWSMPSRASRPRRVANAYAAMEHGPDDRAGAQQDRPASTPGPTKCCEEMEQALAIDPDEVLQVQRQGGPGHRRAARTRSIDRVPPPQGDPDGAAAGDGLRLALRRLPRRDHLRPRDERHGHARGRRSASCSTGNDARSGRAGPVRPRTAAVRGAARPARSAT